MSRPSKHLILGALMTGIAIGMIVIGMGNILLTILLEKPIEEGVGVCSYRIVEMENGEYVVQRHYSDEWRHSSYKDRRQSLKEACERQEVLIEVEEWRRDRKLEQNSSSTIRRVIRAEECK